MNKNTENQIKNQEQLTEQQLNELENDAVWSLLDQAEKESTVEASPMFARNVMREIRVNHGETPGSFWQRLTAPRFSKITLTLGVAAACAALIITQFSQQDPQSGSTAALPEKDETLENITFEDIISLEEPDEDSFTEEMLDLANQDPFFITEEELEIAMQM